MNKIIEKNRNKGYQSLTPRNKPKNDDASSYQSRFTNVRLPKLGVQRIKTEGDNSPTQRKPKKQKISILILDKDKAPKKITQRKWNSPVNSNRNSRLT